VRVKAFVSHYFQNISFVKYENHFLVYRALWCVTSVPISIFKAKFGSDS